MKTIKVSLGKRSYNIVIGNNILPRIGSCLKQLNLGSHAYIITNQAIKNRYAKDLKNSLARAGFNYKFKLIADSEKSKSLNTAYSVIEDLASYSPKKKVFIIAFGGGVVGDLAGFVASIYKRGIAYVQVPTTLLAQVDSSIGGKTAVDLAQGKNLAGAFYQPRLVFSDIALLKTLDRRQILSGLAEVIKYGIIKDAALFRYLEKNYVSIISQDRRALETVVQRSTRIKAKIVEKDECEEKGIRTILNFGHTIGHAVEAAGRYKRYNHGQAIALGMLVACDIGVILGCTAENLRERIERLMSVVGLTTRIKRIGRADIIRAHYFDKKFSGGKNKFVLAEKIGRVRIQKNIPLGVIKTALKHRLSG